VETRSVSETAHHFNAVRRLALEGVTTRCLNTSVAPPEVVYVTAEKPASLAWLDDEGLIGATVARRRAEINRRRAETERAALRRRVAELESALADGGNHD